MHVLCVAEKPSIAKEISRILSGGQSTTRNGTNKYCKNFDFTYPYTNATFTVTSVMGHLTTKDFPQDYRLWTACDPFLLFDAPVITKTGDSFKTLETNLKNEARRANTLMIWTDCDREGEHIGSEIADICRRANRNIVVNRARFSALIAQQIHHAAQNPVPLDMAQAHAVEARTLLDLRLGAAFTRMQTLLLQQRFPGMRDENKTFVSYGPCQFPTLGFVVARYNQVKAFVPEDFWYIFLSLSRQTSSKGQNEETVFAWRRGHIFDEDFALVLYEHVQSNPRVRVTKVTKKTTKKWKPLPLTTVELQKAASRLLRIAPKKVLEVAEHLYQQGFLSYPRTETDQFDPQFDFMTLIQKQTTDPTWGAFASGLQNGGFGAPRRGKNNDKAHPPIHPTAHAANLAGQEKQVYEFITRRFLACCSKDAEGFETTVDVVSNGEFFYATGLIVLERNYLEVYPYDKWSSKEIPDFAEGEEFMPTKLELKTGQTTSPTCLTEADLVTLMDKNGIGTDATIATHIATIVERGYVHERMSGNTKHLIPSALGIGLVEGYNDIGFERSLSKPQLRRETERRMVQVCEGTKTKNDMLQETIDQYKDIFIRAKAEFNKIYDSVNKHMNEDVEGFGLGGGGGAGGGGGGGGGAGGGGGRGGRGGGGARGGRGRGAARGGGDPPARGRGGGGGGRRPAAPRPPDSDDDGPPPPPRPRGRPPASSSASASTSNAAASSSNAVNCSCGVAAVRRTVTSNSASKGRAFWGCGSDVGCGFFEFVDGPGAVAGPSRPAPAPPPKTVPAKRPVSSRGQPPAAQGGAQRMCKCNVVAASLTVVKEGVNKGRRFHKCSQEKCDFWEWDDAPPGTGGAPAAAGGGGAGKGECFKCHMDGHWASECPNEGDASASKRPRSFAGNADSSGSKQGECFKCHQVGHWSNACPNGDGPSAPAPKTARSAKRGRGSRGGSTRGKGKRSSKKTTYDDY
ncbi:hypothetical protein PLICRDRAFT_89135 [Plicaturopsis crispa FD-325 SS-3]|nr:hypothetical protein PLICRDRAFT_89135 [Plicaturopsis crispa FD-325 SS-3]